MKKVCSFCLILFIGINVAFSQIRWDSLGPRMKTLGNLGPDVMYADSNYLYMAGAFKTIDNMHIQGIGRWNGVKWDSMGAGIDGLVYDSALGDRPSNTWSITTYQNKLYVGGVFKSLGKVNALYIGTWDGSAWDSIPIQPFKSNYSKDFEVGAMDVINNKLYVGGAFDTVAGFPCNGIAQWDGSSWSGLNFPNMAYFEYISAICEYNGSIYVGGNFYDTTPDDSSSMMLRWDGSNWLSVGGGIKGSSISITSMVVYNGELYVAGYFFQPDGNAGNYIQRWNGTSWSGVGGGTGGVNGEIWQLLVHNGKLYALGEFDIAGGVVAHEVAEWDGTKWCSLGSTFDNTITTGYIYKDTLYIGGGFNTIDGETIIYNAKWLGGNYIDTCGNDATAINEPRANNENIRVFPNPNNGIFTIESQVTSNQSLVEIYNVLGEKVLTKTLPQNQTNNIDLTGQPSGVYFYRALKKSGELIGEGKIIVEH